MRNTILILAAIALTGCVTQKPAMPVSNIQSNNPATTSAAALVFDPPIAMNDEPIELSRADRGQAALIGYEDVSTSSYGIYTDNREASDGSDCVVRESFSLKYGTTRR